MLQHVLQTRRAQTRVDRHPHDAAQHQRVDQVNMLGTVAEHHGDAIALYDALLAEPRLPLRDVRHGLAARDRAIVEIQEGSRRIGSQTVRQQRRAVEFVVRMTIWSIFRIPIHKVSCLKSVNGLFISARGA